MDAYLQDPQGTSSDAVKVGAQKRQERAKREEKRAAEHQRLARILRKSGNPVTIGLIATCTILFVLTLFPQFVIVKYVLMFPRVFELSDIPLWQAWRTVTPILLHGGIFHIMFNMMWIYSIGPLVESRLTTWQMLFLVLVIALVSNISFFFVSGPNFLGMSGVIYGFIGFLWANDRVAPHPQITLDEGTFKFFAIWYVVCWILSGLSIMPIANTIHGVGGMVGIVFGFFANGHWKKLRIERVADKNSRYTLALVLLMTAGGVIVDYAVHG